MKRFFCLLACTLCCASMILAATTTPIKLPVNQWLVSPALEVHTPFFADSALEAESFLENTYLDLQELRPTESITEAWLPDQDFKWQKNQSEQITWGSLSDKYAVAYAATYLVSARYQEVPLTVESQQPVVIYFDGKKMKKENCKLQLHRGKHLLIIQTVAKPKEDKWTVKAMLQPDQDGEMLSLSIDPRFAPASWADGVKFDGASSPVLSPDGKLLALLRSHRNAEYKRESWLELYDTKTQKLLQTIRTGKGISNPFFFSKGKTLCYSTDGESGSTIWTMDLATHEVEQVASGIKGLQKLICSPDEKYLFYSTDNEEEDDADYKLYTELTDRLSDWTRTRQLFMLSLENKSVRNLNATGDFAIDEFALSQEGDRLVFTRRLRIPERPYFSTEFWLYQIKSGDLSLLQKQPIAFETRPLNLTFLPGGDKIVYTSAANLTIPENALRSMSELDLWMLDIKTKVSVNVTNNAKWTISEEGNRNALFFNPVDKKLWFTAMFGGQMRIMKTDLSAKSLKFEEVKTPQTFVSDLDMAESGSTIAYVASSPATPPVIYIQDLKTNKTVELVNPNENLVKQVDLAAFERWNFMNVDGDSIEGLVFYPPNFSDRQKWPLVVYYYAGTSPRDEHFTFTYHWWAANGYVVYVLNPVGCTGYNQAFADKHVNDWGTLASRDIIEGTKKLLVEKRFLDPKKVAAYGGSYGGFITMDLVTKTNMFAAACSMSGISNIASYFGSGQWGYTYGDIALAGSYPWNRPELFTGKSPVYHADSVHTPLLLTHGTDDVNVPALESDQMFVALRLLNKNVALVKFKGEDHGFSKYTNDIAEREMMLSWFDKWLKGEPEGWDAKWKK